MDTKTLLIIGLAAWFLLRKKKTSTVIVGEPEGNFESNGIKPVPVVPFAPDVITIQPALTNGSDSYDNCCNEVIEVSIPPGKQSFNINSTIPDRIISGVQRGNLGSTKIC